MMFLFVTLILSLVLQNEGGSHIRTKRVVGGETVPEGERSSADISLRKVGGNIDTHFCGGVLLNPYWVLTAAHCVVNKNEFDVVIEKKERRRVVQIVKQNFDQHSNYGDIALLQLNRAADGIYAPLPSQDFQPLGLCKLYGYGFKNATKQEVSDTLQTAWVPIINDEECQEVLGPYIKYTNDSFCAGMGVPDACQGDSGGPLFCRQESKLVLTGVVSYGFSCGAPNTPGIYTKVGYYLDWIYQTISKNTGNQTEEDDTFKLIWHKLKDYIRNFSKSKFFNRFKQA